MSNNLIEDDQLILSIDQMLNDISTTMTKPFIRRVSDKLRMRHEKAYDPAIVAIGPFHCGKDRLMDMEHQKMRYLKLLLESRHESSVDRYVYAMRNLEQRARKCYAESIPLDKDEFVKMLLLDGIFIIEFLRRKIWKIKSADDPIFQFQHISFSLLDDLLLFENQIPLFVLEELFRLLEIHDREEISYLIRPLTFTGEMPKEISLCEAEHLLGLVHYASCYSFAQKHSPGETILDNPRGKEDINSAKELKEASIIFKKHEGEGIISLFDIKFKNDTIYIPELIIQDGTEVHFRNMLAYEYYFPRGKQKYITDYIIFMCCLIHSPKDAELLRLCGIITNYIGGDEMVYDLINQLGTNVIFSHRFSYSDVVRDIKFHCTRKRNRWMAILRRDYFDSPWTFISLVAAIILLSTGVIQMVYAILSYNKAS